MRNTERLLVGGLGLFAGLLLGIGLIAFAAEEGEAHGPGEGLLAWMTQLQYLSHKTHLAIAAEDGPQAGFYLHELEETIEGLEHAVPDYDGHPVGRLAAEMLARPLAGLEEAVESRSWNEALERSQALVEACNACHTATEHGMIRVAVPQTNPFAQEFGSGG